MKMKRIWWGFLMIASVALLAGCGGGGGTSLMVGGDRATQSSIDALEAGLGTAQDEVTRLTTELETATGSAASLKTMLDDATANVTSLTTMRDDAQATADGLQLMLDAAPTPEEVAALTLERDNAQGDVTRLTTELETATGSAASLQTMLNDANDTIQDLRDEIATLTPTEPTPDSMAAALAPAIADPDGDGKFPEDNELSTNRRPGEEPTYMDGGTATIAGDRLGLNDPGILNANEFQVTSSYSRADIGGFNDTTYTRTIDGKKDTVTIYSDVKPNKDENFNDYFDAVRATASTAIDSVTADGDLDTLNPDGARTTKYRTLVFAADADLTAMGAMITGSQIPTGATGTRTVSETIDQDDSFTGMYYGVPGTFECTGGDCTLEQSISDGVRETGAGALSFTPSPTVNDTQDAHRIIGVIRDVDFLSFGYWVQETTSGGTKRYGVNVFAGGSTRFDDNAVDDDQNAAIMALQGSATYEGPATGMYVRKALTVGAAGQVVGTPDASGQFVADVELTATFGEGDNVATSDAYDISGTADNFQDDDGNLIDLAWTLSLNAAEFGTEAGTDHRSTFTGTTGKGSSMGQWRGAFFGMPVVDDAATTTVNEMAEGHPSGVAGEFTGHFVNGHVIGAFGATEQ